MFKRVLGVTLSLVLVVSEIGLSRLTSAASAAEQQDYQKKIATFNPERVLWTDKMIDEGFANLSPNQSNSTMTTNQTPYGNQGEYLTQWATYEYLWTHGYPIGNGRMAATVMGGIDKEVIQINEDTVWTGSPYVDADGNPTSGSTKDAWQFYRGSNADGTPAAFGEATALVGTAEFRAQFPEFANKSISNQSLNVVNNRELSSVQQRYNLISMVEKYFLGSPKSQKSYQSFVENYLDFGQKNENVTNYTKSLDMDSAIVTVDYDYGSAHYTRETLASYPDQTVATNVKVTGGTLDFTTQLHTYLENATFEKISDNQVKITAKVKDGKTSEVGGASAINIEARMIVDAPGATLSVSDDMSSISIKGGQEASVYIVGATNYVDYLTLDASKPKKDCDSYVSKLSGKTYAQIRQSHVNDYAPLFAKSSFSLTNDKSFNAAGIPTEERIRKDVSGKSGFSMGAGNKLSAANTNNVYSTLNDGDNQLAVLEFNFGKFLMIEGSRDGDSSNQIDISQPLNLTGKWNPSLSPSWGGKYTININTEMNYWLAQPLNLASCEKPLLSVFADLAKSGAITANEQYGITNNRGDSTYQPGDPWVMHHNFDLWKGTQPIDNATAGVWPTGGVWLLDHAWEYYEYNLDKDYLAQFYPLMVGACRFFTQFLVVDPQTGYLITAASVSPEQGSVQPGPAMDTQLVRNLYSTTLEAAKILGTETQDATLLAKVKEQLPKNGYLSDEKNAIAPNLIDSTGLIKEWVRGDVGFDFSTGTTWTVTNPFSLVSIGYKEHVASNNTAHRHCSNLWELYPGTHLNAYSTDANEQKIYKAFQKSVTARDAGSGQGWGLAWRVALSARALDGETAFSRIEQLIRTRTSPNLLGQHPNFQIDCNYGVTAGVVEMLMQSNDGTINILPAIPDRWANGQFAGFKARGNVEIGAKWSNSVPTQIDLKAGTDGNLKVRNANMKGAVVKDATGKIITTTMSENDTVISFDAKANGIYSITGFLNASTEPGNTETSTWKKLANVTTDFFGTFSTTKNAIVTPKQENGGDDVGYIWDDRKGTEVGYAYPDCSLDGLTKLALNVNGKVIGNIKISVRLNDKNGEEIATGTATKGAYTYVDMAVTKKLTGTAKLFVVFTGDSSVTYNEAYMCNVKDLVGTFANGTTDPTTTPTTGPTEATTVTPTQATTVAPTQATTVAPTQATTVTPTQATTVAPTQATTVTPTQATTVAPTVSSTTSPTISPSIGSTVAPIVTDKEYALSGDNGYSAVVGKGISIQANGKEVTDFSKLTLKVEKDGIGYQTAKETINALIKNNAIIVSDDQKIQYYEVSLLAGEEEATFFGGKIKVTFPYPDLTNATNFQFKILHVKNSGTTETLIPVLGDLGLTVEVDGFSPFAIVYNEVQTTSMKATENPTTELSASEQVSTVVKSGDHSMAVVYLTIIMVSGMMLVFTGRRKRVCNNKK